MKLGGGRVRDRGSTAGGTTLHLYRCVRLHSCFVADLEGEITSKGSILLAPARPADSKGKLLNSPTGDKMDKRKHVIS